MYSFQNDKKPPVPVSPPVERAVCAIIPAASNNARYFLFFILFLSPFFTILFFIDLITLSHLNKIVIITPHFRHFAYLGFQKRL